MGTVCGPSFAKLLGFVENAQAAFLPTYCVGAASVSEVRESKAIPVARVNAFLCSVCPEL